jgi:hypothetical protein
MYRYSALYFLSDRSDRIRALFAGWSTTTLGQITERKKKKKRRIDAPGSSIVRALTRFLCQ